MFFGRILTVPHENQYKVQTEWGKVDRLIPTRVLQRVLLILTNTIKINSPNNKLTLGMIAKKNSNSDRVIISCKYKKKYTTKRCNCFKNKMKYSIYCYSDTEHDCGYLASLALRTKVAMVKNYEYTKKTELKVIHV
jgi:hypothetical protein